MSEFVKPCGCRVRYMKADRYFQTRSGSLSVYGYWSYCGKHGKEHADLTARQQDESQKRAK